MFYQQDSKKLFENNDVITKLRKKYFEDDIWTKLKSEYDSMWEDWILHDSVEAHKAYGGEWAGSGTLDYIEGLLIYSFVRTKQPEIMMEIGAAEGISTAIIGSALKENGKGFVISVDLNQPGSPNKIFTELEKSQIIQFIRGDGIAYVQAIQNSIKPDFIFLDAEHDENFCRPMISTLKNAYPDAFYLYHEWALSTISSKPEIEMVSRTEWLFKFWERPCFEEYFDKSEYKHDGFPGSCGLGLVEKI